MSDYKLKAAWSVYAFILNNGYSVFVYYNRHYSSFPDQLKPYFTEKREKEQQTFYKTNITYKGTKSYAVNKQNLFLFFIVFQVFSIFCVYFMQ